MFTDHLWRGISASCFIFRLQENSGDYEEEITVPEYVLDKDALNFFGKEAHITLLTTSTRNFFKIIK